MNISQQKKTLIANSFPKLWTRINVVKEMSQKSCFRGHIGGRLGEREEALLKSGLHQLYHSYWSLWRQLGCKKSLLLIWKDLTLFLNGLTAHEWYSRCNGDNLRKPNHMHLSHKQETFPRSFSLNFWNLHEI